MASSVIGALRVNLSIDTAQFEEGLKGVRANLTNVGKSFQNWGTKLSTYVTAPLSIAGAAVTAAVTGMARDVDQLAKAAQVANTGFEEFQKLAFAARSVGIESDKLADIYKDVNDRIGDFIQTGGGPMADFFEKIAPQVGVTADQFARLSGPEALQLFYSSLEQANLSQADMTFYLEAMASDATALIPLLRDGGAAMRELGEGAAVLSAEDASSLKAYNDAVLALGQSFKALTIALVNTGVLETLTAIVQGVTTFTTKLSETNPEIVKWSAILAAAAAAIGPVALGIGVLVTALAAVSAPVLAFGAGVVTATAAAAAFWPQIVQLKDAIVALAQSITAEFEALPGRMIEIGKAIIDGLWQGLSSAWSSIKGGVSSIATGVANIFRSENEIKSPSRVMMEIGNFMMQGLGQGMESMSGQVEGIASNIASTVSQAFQGLIDGSKTVKDVIKDLLSQLSTMWINQGFQALLGGGMKGGGGGLFGGLFSGLGKILGFSRGGTILPGGAGGIDSQLVMFRKSPNERVDISKPGQTLDSGGRATDVRVYVDENGNWQAAVERIADRRSALSTQAGISQFSNQLDRSLTSRMNKAQQRQG